MSRNSHKRSSPYSRYNQNCILHWHRYMYVSVLNFCGNRPGELCGQLCSLPLVADQTQVVESQAVGEAKRRLFGKGIGDAGCVESAVHAMYRAIVAIVPGLFTVMGKSEEILGEGVLNGAQEHRYLREGEKPHGGLQRVIS